MWPQLGKWPQKRLRPSHLCRARRNSAKESSFSKAKHEEWQLLYWALVFFIIAIIAGFFGFFGVAGAAAGIAKILFFVFVVLLVLSLLFGGWRRGPTI